MSADDANENLHAAAACVLSSAIQQMVVADHTAYAPFARDSCPS
ncbi:MAG: hypothetical protein WBC04_22420 [Candidatus Acidiferrales bacterium]